MSLILLKKDSFFTVMTENGKPIPIGAPSDLHQLYKIEKSFVDLYKKIADCPACELARFRTKTVPGSGPSTSKLMLIGEGPGEKEDELGLPFVGRSGQFLEKMLLSIGLSRDEVYITNVVKCRPPSNRDPSAQEIQACDNFLQQQIAIVNPTVIATLGRFSMSIWFPNEKISQIHGEVREIDGRLIIPMYHPAAALRNGSLRKTVQNDFLKIKKSLIQKTKT